ncbi:hypothetical protein HYS97_02815 [Candidatus Daviesbacteria bacterium]|nr:hypothetical protein [Candidatus Daviesbacteria bacterium]
MFFLPVILLLLNFYYPSVNFNLTIQGGFIVRAECAAESGCPGGDDNEQPDEPEPDPKPPNQNSGGDGSQGSPNREAQDGTSFQEEIERREKATPGDGEQTRRMFQAKYCGDANKSCAEAEKGWADEHNNELAKYQQGGQAAVEKSKAETEAKAAHDEIAQAEKDLAAGVPGAQDRLNAAQAKLASAEERVRSLSDTAIAGKTNEEAAVELGKKAIAQGKSFDEAVKAANAYGLFDKLRPDQRAAVIGKIGGAANLAGTDPNKIVDKAIEVEKARNTDPNAMSAVASIAMESAGGNTTQIAEAGARGDYNGGKSVTEQILSGVAAANSSGDPSREAKLAAGVAAGVKRAKETGLSPEELGSSLRGAQTDNKDELIAELKKNGVSDSDAKAIAEAWDKARGLSNPVTRAGGTGVTPPKIDPKPGGAAQPGGQQQPPAGQAPPADQGTQTVNPTASRPTQKDDSGTTYSQDFEVKDNQGKVTANISVTVFKDKNYGKQLNPAWPDNTETRIEIAGREPIVIKGEIPDGLKEDGSYDKAKLESYLRKKGVIK